MNRIIYSVLNCISYTYRYNDTAFCRRIMVDIATCRRIIVNTATCKIIMVGRCCNL